MADKPLEKYIKTPPPTEARSHFTYLEDQLTKLENVSNSHVIRIAENAANAEARVTQEMLARAEGDSAQAQYTLEIAAETLDTALAEIQTVATAATTANSALASQITTLNASVNTVSGAITNEASLRVTGDTALGTRIDNLVLTNSNNSAAVIIDSEASARITADLALGSRIDSVTSTLGTATAAITTEQTTRATQDQALAQQLFTMSSGSTRVFLSDTPPEATGRQPGDVWFETDANFKPYVWARLDPTATDGSYAWRDNSSGLYTNNVGNYAVYTSNIQTLTNTVGDSTTGLVNDVTALQTTVGDSTAGIVKDLSAVITKVGDSASGIVKDVTTLQSTTAAQRIFRQSTMPSTVAADRKVGDIWYNTTPDVNGVIQNIPNFWNGTSWVATGDNTRATTGALTTESTARSNADSALASYVMTASAGTSRVYTSDPGTSGRVRGDTWFRTTENFKPYVWAQINDTGAFNWRDNSTGEYTKYVGQIASVTTTATAALNNANSANTAASNAQNTTNNLSYEWRVQGTIDGQPAGSLKLTGAKRSNTDGTTSTVSKLIIDANCDINGDLIVSGNINGARIGTGSSGIATDNIQNNAVSSSGYVTGTGTQTINIAVRPGATVQVTMVYNSGDSTTSSGKYSNFNNDPNNGKPNPAQISSMGNLTISRDTYTDSIYSTKVAGTNVTYTTAVLGNLTSFGVSAAGSTGYQGLTIYYFDWQSTYTSLSANNIYYYKNTSSSIQYIQYSISTTFTATNGYSILALELAR